MTPLAETLLAEIEAEKEAMVAFFQRFVRAPTANPPGDTRAGVKVLGGFLEERGLPFRIVAPQAEMPNIVGTFECGRPGRHLVLNGHIDVFPPGEAARWKHGDPWSGTIEDGQLYGRGTADMKCGTTASFLTYALLHRHREALGGKLTLTAVSDEETGGRWGTGYLLEHHGAEVLGDCCLNGEPSSAWTVRYGEKAPMWLVFTAKARGAHGAYVHMSASATKIATKLMARLEEVTTLEPEVPDAVRRNLADPAVRAALDGGLGAGAADIVGRVTLNIGVVEGGLKTNMIPSECRLEADIRLPVGVAKAQIWAIVNRILQDFPEVTVEEESRPDDGPNFCDPEGEMLGYIQEAAERVRGHRPVPVITLAGTDARYWRLAGTPAYIYGCSPGRMATFDECVAIEDFLHVVRVHVLAASAYLAG